jgi:hypothetical protein
VEERHAPWPVHRSQVQDTRAKSLGGQAADSLRHDADEDETIKVGKVSGVNPSGIVVLRFAQDDKG